MSRTLCIFTPTYNRAYCLENLYSSLLEQTCDDFEWLVVDDGSTDETPELMARLAADAPFAVTCIRQSNGGKQRAHNTGVEQCSNELFICVDSDDVMPPHAVELILSLWKDARGDIGIAGVIALCGKNADEPLGTYMPAGVNRTTMWDLYYKHGHKGDTALIHRTEVLKCFPFELAPGEKFMAETYVYHQIDQGFELAVLDEVAIIREYLPDGYTANVRKVTRENPVDYMNLKRMYVDFSDTPYLKLYNSTLYMVGCMLSGTKGGVRNAPSPGYAAFGYLPAKALTKTVYKEPQEEGRAAMRRIELDEMKRLEVELLDVIDAFCRKHGLRYYLSAGTLLGAVRHKGFIPWDDDIDLMMPREDYERFYELFMAQNANPDVRLISYRDKTSPYPFLKLVDTRTKVIETYVDPKYATGVWVDIFPLDGLSDGIHALNARVMRKYGFAVANTNVATTPARKLVKKATKGLFANFDIYKLAAELDAACAATPIREGEDLGMAMWTTMGERSRFPFELLEQVELEFEGRRYLAPRIYDEYLTRIYGDYMQLPPEDKRKPHPCEAYWLES